MKILLINSDPTVRAAVDTAVAQVNDTAFPAGGGRGDDHLQIVSVGELEPAIEYINYQMPPLILLNFSDPAVDAFEVMQQITADSWLNHGGIVALYAGSGTFDRVSELQAGNIIIHLAHHDLVRPLAAVLGIVRDNRQVLFQRALHTDLLGTMSGRFELAQDVQLVPAYANLVANYLFNVGFVGSEAKARVSLVLTELLMNAIEHGNCGISFEAKRAHLAAGGSVQELIAQKCRNAAIRERRVHYSFQIYRTHSVHVIRDDGAGFDWRTFMDRQREVDFLAEHGRGILLARQTADRISYNDAGNEVTLEIRHDSSEASIPRAFQDSDILQCQPGDVIFNQGESSDFLYYVAEGVFRVLVNGRHVANLSPADVLMGEMSLLLEERRSATVIADTPGRLIKISRQDFIRIVKDQPYYAVLLARLMAQRLHRLGRGVLS